MWKRFTQALALALLLSGCQSVPTLAPNPATEAASGRATMPPSDAGRHLLDAGSNNDACIWAIQYAQSLVRAGTARGYYTDQRWEITQEPFTLPAGALIVNRYDEELNSNMYDSICVYLTGDANLAGKGALQKAAYNRYVYRVPNDQMLVINRIGGDGSISIDGYAVSADRGDVHYVFGSGEVVVLGFSPSEHDVPSTPNMEGYFAGYHGLTLEGFTVSPGVLAGVSGMLADEAK